MNIARLEFCMRWDEYGWVHVFFQIRGWYTLAPLLQLPLSSPFIYPHIQSCQSFCSMTKWHLTPALVMKVALPWLPCQCHVPDLHCSWVQLDHPVNLYYFYYIIIDKRTRHKYVETIGGAAHLPTKIQKCRGHHQLQSVSATGVFQNHTEL